MIFSYRNEKSKMERLAELAGDARVVPNFSVPTFLFVLIALVSTAYAQMEDESKNPIFYEVKDHIAFEEFGTTINMYTGRFNMNIPVLSVPGNSDLFVGVSLQQFPDGEYSSPEPFALPMITGVLPCGENEPPFRDLLEDLGETDGANSGALQTSSYWNDYTGMYLHIPGRGPTRLAWSLAGESWIGGSLDNHTVKCTDNWDFQSAYDAYTGAGGTSAATASYSMSMEILTPDGVTYTFEQLTDWGRVEKGDGVLVASRAEDAFGNWVEYHHTDGLLDRITSNDQREITFTYPNNTDLSFASFGRVWSWTGQRTNPARARDTEGGDGTNQLVLPDSTAWTFSNSGSGNAFVIPNDHCQTQAGTVSVINPYGARLDLDVQPVIVFAAFHNSNLGGRNISQSQYRCSPDVPAHQNTALRRKSVHGGVWGAAVSVPGAQATHAWTFDYEIGWDKPVPTDPTVETFELERTVTKPDGSSVVYKFDSHSGSNFIGVMLNAKVYESNGALTLTYEPEYTLSPLKLPLGGADDLGAETGGAALKQRQLLLSRAEITLGSDVYTTVYDYDSVGRWDLYALPTRIEKSSNVNSGSRVEELTYRNMTTSSDGVYRVGLPATVTHNGKLFDEYLYADQTAPGRMSQHRRFDAAYKDYTYHSDGTVHTLTDAVGRTTTFSDYKRGRPQSTVRPDLVEVLVEVDDNGWVTREREPRGTIWTGYEYNDVGWRTKIDRQSGTLADTDFIHDLTDVSFGTMTITERQGGYEQATTFDGYNRPTVIKTQDVTDIVGTRRYVLTEYDGLGRVKKVTAPNTTASLSNFGIETTYDALGRVLMQRETTSPFAATQYEYLSGNRVRVTDPEGNVTTTTRTGYGNPDDGEIDLIEQPEGINTKMTYDAWGNMLTARQYGSSNGVLRDKTQRYTYDDRLRLCRHYASEHGSSLYLYNAGDELIEEAHGLSGTTGCAFDLPNADTITHIYNTLGDLDITRFGDGSPDINYEYDANQNLYEVYRGSTRRTFRYHYTGTGDLLKEDTLRMDGFTFMTRFGFTPEGHADYQIFPSGRRIEFGVDALGQAREARQPGSTTFASALSYHPNGLLASLTFGNTKSYTQTLNSRQLPYMREYTDGLKAYHVYDANKRITHIDRVTDNTGDRDYEYDGVGRLEFADGPWGTASYGYDVLGNIMSVTRSEDYVAEGFNRSFAYDARGNITNDGNHGFVYDLMNQPVTLTGAATGTFIYDGLLKRSKQVIDGETIYSHYGLDGTLYHRLKLDASGQNDEETDFIRAGGMAIARIQEISGVSEKLTYIYTDHLGSPYMGANSAGVVTWTDETTPYGESWGQSPADQANMPGFTGHIEDTATGLTYMQARYYDPALLRFLSNDPVPFSPARPYMFGRYTYAANDPINVLDPDGRFPVAVDPKTMYSSVPDGRLLATSEAKSHAVSATIAAAAAAPQIVAASGLSGTTGAIVTTAAQGGAIAGAVTSASGGSATEVATATVGGTITGGAVAKAGAGLTGVAAAGAKYIAGSFGAAYTAIVVDAVDGEINGSVGDFTRAGVIGGATSAVPVAPVTVTTVGTTADAVFNSHDDDVIDEQ